VDGFAHEFFTLKVSLFSASLSRHKADFPAPLEVSEMILNQFQLSTHIAPFLLAALIFFLLARPPLADAQEMSGDFFWSSSFERRSEISGTVYLEKNNSPASEVIVTIRSVPAGIARSVLSDFDGRFRIGGLSRGTYQVTAESDGCYSAQVTAQINGFPSDISLHLKPMHPGQSQETGSLVSVRQLKIPDKARGEYDRGIASLLKQDPAESLAHLNKAVQNFPGYYEAYYHMGVADIRLSRADKAMEEFQKAIDLSGGRYSAAQFAYGLLLSNRGKQQEGERIIRAGLETDPDSAEGHFFLAMSLVAGSHLDEAEKSVNEALLRKPNLADAYLVLSDIHAGRDDYAAQLHDLDTFLKLAPNAPQAEKIRKIREVVQRLITEKTSATGRNALAN